MKELFLSEIISSVNAETVNFVRDFAVGGVSTDTRTLKEGDIFIALKGKVYDGHDFVSVAALKKACAIISSRHLDTALPVLKVRDTLRALGDLASYYRAGFNIPVIAVTGSSGKSTVKNMIAAVLSARFHVFCSDKNFNNEIGLPKSVLELDGSYDAAVFEMGMNHAGEIKALSEIARPDIAVITNIGKAHIGNLGSKENIFKAKTEILSGLKDGGAVITNSDDIRLKNIKSDIHDVLFIGSSGDIYAENIESRGNHTLFDVNFNGSVYPCVLPAIGRHNVSNALFALLCAARLGIDIHDAANELRRYTVSSMRTEIAYIKGVTVIKDYYNSSPDSMSAALSTLADYKSQGGKIAVLGEMNELGDFSEAEHFTAAQECLRYGLDYTFFIGKDYGAFKKGIGEKGECFAPNERGALSKSLKRYISQGFLNRGDVILIKGSRNMKMEEYYEEIKRGVNAAHGDFAPHQGAAKLYVDVSAVKFNYSQIKKAVGAGVCIMPMIKANAYGCGSDIIANIFKDSKYLAVADVKEAALLKLSLPDANFVLIYQPRVCDIEAIVSDGYIPAVSDTHFAVKLNEESARQGRITKIHIEVDTGMCRLGIHPDGAVRFAEEIFRLANIRVEGIFTHYVCAESFREEDLAFTERQTGLFIKAACGIESVTGKVAYKHACAGAAVFNQKASHFDMVRPGYMLYGYYPSPALRDMVNLKPALKYVSVILQIRETDAGIPVGYNRRYVTGRKSRLATVAVGYADGIYRRLFDPKNKRNGAFVVNGQRAPIAGTVSMDMTVIDITDIKGSVEVGDEVAVFDNINVTVEEMAEICDTVGYEIIAKIEDRADRAESF